MSPTPPMTYTMGEPAVVSTFDLTGSILMAECELTAVEVINENEFLDPPLPKMMGGGQVSADLTA